MNVHIKRIYTNTEYTIGHLYVDGVFVCDTLEDTDRGWNSHMSDAWIRNNKVHGKSAIPSGSYALTLDVVSPRFSKKKYYKEFCGGKLPRLLNVTGFDGVLIHIGNTASDTDGCVLCGYNKEKGKVLNSKKAFEKLYRILQGAKNHIYVNITRTYKV